MGTKVIIPGYRIDGVSACRLAVQWFQHYEHLVKSGYHNPMSEMSQSDLPKKEEFIDRKVEEPLAVRLAGEYDIWDKRDPNAELFQHGLRSRDLDGWWEPMLSDQCKGTVSEIENMMKEGAPVELLPNGNIKIDGLGERLVNNLLKRGEAIQYARDKEYEQVIKDQGFTVDFEGVTFLACCSHECDIRSHLFEAGIQPWHDALLGFTWTGKEWRVSLYRITGKDTNVLSIAKKFGGGGHAGACGFFTKTLPFLT